MPRTRLLPALALATLAFATTRPLAAQQPTTAPVVADLLGDVTQLEKKLVDLARAIPADKYDWRPAQGVRSVGEVFLHVAADNYLLPTAVGVPADPATGIKDGDFQTASAYEARKLGRDATIAEMEKSFAHLKQAMAATTTDQLTRPVSLFGQRFTVQRTWILTTTHLHEHLGQMIAYARSVGVVPPWSR